MFLRRHSNGAVRSRTAPFLSRLSRAGFLCLCNNLSMRWFWTVCHTAVLCLAQDDMARARRIQSEVIGIDTHIDTAQRLLIGGVGHSKRPPPRQSEPPRLREGRV